MTKWLDSKFLIVGTTCSSWRTTQISAIWTNKNVVYLTAAAVVTEDEDQVGPVLNVDGEEDDNGHIAISQNAEKEGNPVSDRQNVVAVFGSQSDALESL